MQAIDVLVRVDKFLMIKENHNPGGIALSGECFIAMLNLKSELMAEMPVEVEIEKDEK